MYINAQFQFSRIVRPLTWAPLACLCVWFSQVLMPTPAHAQASTAAINGTVVDSSGGAVPDADVALQSVDTGVVREPCRNLRLLEYPAGKIQPGGYENRVSAQHSQ